MRLHPTVRRLAEIVIAALGLLAMALLFARPAGAQVFFVADLAGVGCVDGSPRIVMVIDGADATDCATGLGTIDVVCVCLDGAWVGLPTTGGAGGGYATCQEEGVSLTQRSTLNFVGASITCADAGGKTVCTLTDADTKITLDLGDDGGNDSTALAEVATSGDTYAVVTEPSADKALLNLSRMPTYGEQHFDRPPASCFLCDEFTDGASTLTWAWGNQDSATVTLENDGLNLDSVNTNEYHAYCIDTATHSMPVNSDQVWCAKVTATIDTPTEICGLAVVEAGTLASPTEISSFGPLNASVDGFAGAGYTAWTLTGSASHAAYNFTTYDVLSSDAVYIKMSYVDSTRAVTESFSFDGKRWQNITTGTATTLSADPVTWCIVGRNAANCFWDFVRLRTDAGRETCGE